MTDKRPNSSGDLDRRIAAAKAEVEADAATETSVASSKGYGQGSRVLAELIGAPFGGGVIGFGIDYLFGTTPWFLVILLILGFVVAFRNVYRISKERAE